MDDGKINDSGAEIQDQGPASVERPEELGNPGEPIFGSDVIARAIRSLDIPYVALNPGASYRGLHDSLVNYLGNETPQMLLCLHEEAAVAIAHGYAKVTGKPMLAAVHSNVGLMHATMAVFNAWCDRVPLILLGATGPVDAARRRPYIDWLHTAADQGALLRGYTKWDDQPYSAAAAQESLMRGAWLSQTAPCGPVYINLDSEVQEQPVKQVPPPLDPSRFIPAAETGIDAKVVEKIAGILKGAKKPVIFMGRMSNKLDDWNNRVALAERIGGKVITHRKVGAVFPTDHELHAGHPATRLDAEAAKAVAEADVVLSLYWLDLAGSLKMACKKSDPDKTIIHVSVDHHLHNGWSMDHQAHPATDVFVPGDPDKLVALLLEHLPEVESTYEPRPERQSEDHEVMEGRMSPAQMTQRVRKATEGRKVSVLHTPTSWNGADWHYRHPLDYIGSEGGGGIGGGPGVSVGAALALVGTDRFPLTFVGDGDFLMGVTAFWTAVHYKIPLLVIIANNQSFYNDEVHQKKVAEARKRPVENKWIGLRMTDPEIDLAAMATAQGALGLGPARTPEELDAYLEQAIAHVDAGGVAVIEARVVPGYTKDAQAGMAGNLEESISR